MSYSVSKKKFPAVLIAMLGSTIPISIIGTKFAMSVTPFWAPIRFGKDDDVLAGSSTFHLKLTPSFFKVPVVGMLCGQSVSGIVVAVSYVLREFQYVTCEHWL